LIEVKSVFDSDVHTGDTFGGGKLAARRFQRRLTAANPNFSPDRDPWVRCRYREPVKTAGAPRPS
jgi:hypothetical protein